MDSVHRLDYSQGRPAAGPAPAYQGPPPPRPPPPSYFAAVRRRVPSSLRPVLLFATFLSFIYLIAVAVTSFRYLSSSTETAKLKLFDIISGVLYLVGAVTEAFGLYAVWTSKLPLVLLHARASVVGLVVVVAAQIINIVSHYTGKKDIIDGCTAKYTGAAACTGYSSWWGGWGCSQSEPLSATDAANYCQSNWQKESIWVFVWLFIVLILGGIFVSLSFAFARQLRDPSWRNRSTQTPASGAYSNAFTYDDESSPFDTRTPGGEAGRYSYEDDPRYAGGLGPHSYPPPPGAPPGEAVPNYEPPAGRKSMASVDLDRKDPNLASYANYSSNRAAEAGPQGERPDYNRPGSSRSVYRNDDGDDDRATGTAGGIRPEHQRAVSEDTVKGDGDADNARTHARI